MSGSAALKCLRVPFFPPCGIPGHAESKIIPCRRPSVELGWVCVGRCVFLRPLVSDWLQHPRNCLEPYNTFDGPGFPACRDVAKVYSPKTVEEAVSIVKDASDKGLPVRASGVSSPLSVSFQALFFILFKLCCSRMATCGVSVFSYFWSVFNRWRRWYDVLWRSENRHCQDWELKSYFRLGA